jgi:peptide/nickel transport system substrate-binding protein
MRRPATLLPAIAAGAVLLLVAACGSSSSSTPAGPSASVSAPTDKVLHLSFLQDPGQPPDPDVYYAGQGLLLTTNLYEGLLTYAGGTDKPTIVPSLAEKWTVSPDKKTYTFTLRKGVTFHDGTPFTAAAVKPSFDRRAAVNQGPAYMVSDIASVTTKGDHEVTITLKNPSTIFLDYLAAAYGPKMFSPTALTKHAGSDHAQTYLQTHSIGTGPYTLTDAKVGSHYAMKAFDKYWGPKPYFTDVDIPVITDSSSQQLQFGKGQLAAILHDLPSTAVASYLKNTAISSYALPTMMSDYLYVNPNTPFGQDKARRLALLQAVDRDAVLKQAYAGRGDKASSAYPGNMAGTGDPTQAIEYKPDVLKGMAASIPAEAKSVTIGYDSQSSDNQLVANLLAAQLSALGLTAKVQSYPTSQIFGWVSDVKGAPDVLVTTGWPDAAPAYTWSHISFDKDAGLNYLHCSDPEIGKQNAAGLLSGDAATFAKVAELANGTGCWYNLVDIQDFVVAQPWLKGVEQAHVVSEPTSLRVAALSVG